MSTLDPEYEALALAELAKRIKARTETVRTVVGMGYLEGDKRTFRSPVDGRKLGQVYRTDPNPVWRVVDRDALHGHLSANPANTELAAEITDHEQACAVLYEYAPHLLAFITRVTEAAEQDAMNRATAGETVPGIEKVKPDGVLTVKVDPATAGAAVEGLISAGLMTWDGRIVVTDDSAAVA